MGYVSRSRAPSDVVGAKPAVRADSAVDRLDECGASATFAQITR